MDGGAPFAACRSRSYSWREVVAKIAQLLLTPVPAVVTVFTGTGRKLSPEHGRVVMDPQASPTLYKSHIPRHLSSILDPHHLPFRLSAPRIFVSSHLHPFSVSHFPSLPLDLIITNRGRVKLMQC